MAVAHAFNPGTGTERQMEFCDFQDSLVYGVNWVLGQPGLHRKTLSQKTKQKTPSWQAGIAAMSRCGNQSRSWGLTLNCKAERAGHDPLIPILGRQSQPGLQSKFKDRPSFKKKKKKKENKTKLKKLHKQTNPNKKTNPQSWACSLSPKPWEAPPAWDTQQIKAHTQLQKKKKKLEEAHP